MSKNPNHMPLVVLTKGQVIYKKGDMPNIGCRADENPLLEQHNRLLACNMLTKSMSLIQRSLLKGK